VEQEAGQRGVVKGCSQLLTALVFGQPHSICSTDTCFCRQPQQAFLLAHGEKQSTVGSSLPRKWYFPAWKGYCRFMSVKVSHKFFKFS